MILAFLSPASAFGAITWSADSERDNVYDGDIYNAKYDLEDVSAAIFDNDPDQISFYMNFVQVPTLQMFNDGRGSWAYIGLDYDLDGKRDILLIIDGVTLKGDLNSVQGKAWNDKTKSVLNCDVDFFTNINEGKTWVGVQVSRRCLNIPLTFNLSAYAEYSEDFYKGTNTGSWDHAPNPALRVNLPGSSSSNSTGSTVAASGSTHTLPLSTTNSSTESRNYSQAPVGLSSLADALLPSVVTVKCASSSGTGWSADLNLSQALKDSGFQSLVVTNHHVVEDCLSNKSVNLVLSNGNTVPAQVVSWNRSSDVAGIATKIAIPAMQWIGSAPKQGWWVGVLGSPLGKTNVLTTGIISSVNTNTKVFTLTAAINPGNSGGPVFDNTGRVLGLATSKAVLSDGQLAEGFGNAHGVPMLCGTVVTCQIEPDPWSGKSKFAAGPTAEELAAQAAASAAQALVKAKEEAEAKLKEDMRNRCIKLNGDIEVAMFSAKNGQITYPLSSSIFSALLQSAPSLLACDLINISTFEAELQSKQKLLTTFEGAITTAISNAQAVKKKKTTITCVKGNSTRKVTGVNPKCPKGFKKR